MGLRGRRWTTWSLVSTEFPPFSSRRSGEAKRPNFNSSPCERAVYGPSHPPSLRPVSHAYPPYMRLFWVF